MDFKLDIGELTTTINEYENFIKILAEQKENINKAVKELTDLGWSGAAKDKFLENHIKKQEFYINLEEDIKYMKSALESEEKPRAVQFKMQSEDFENCIKRSGGGAALTSDDTGVVSLQYGGQFPINNNVSECTNDYYRRMNSKFQEILNLANSLTFTTFPITTDIENAEKSLRNQTTSLTEFDNSFNAYCTGVRAMEDNICSVFGKISGVTEGISKFRGISVISENGQVDKDKVTQLMLKNSSSLTNEEKELLSYVEKVLGKDEYAELKELEMKEDDDSNFWKPMREFDKSLNESVDNFLAQHFNNPFGKFMSRIAVTGGNIVTFDNGSKEVIDTGSPVSNKIADIIGVCGGFVFNPEAGLEGAMGMVNGIKGFQGFIVRKIENIGNSAIECSFENMAQYIRSVLYGQHQFALPNGMGKVNALEDLFKFSESEGNATKTKYVKSIADLKNTKNFRDSSLNHILEGEINRSGMAVGYHYENFPTSKGKIIEKTKSLLNDFGVYTGKVEVDGVMKKVKSSFFPKEWSAQNVVDAINEAYNNKKFVKGSKNTFRGKSASGLKIEMYIDNNGNIISAFPKY